MNQRWLLMEGNVLVGTIDVATLDQPWCVGRLNPSPAFAQFRDLFSRELALVEGDLDVEEWEESYRLIRERLTLVRPDGTPVREFLLHIKGEEAWFQYSDEPFE